MRQGLLQLSINDELVGHKKTGERRSEIAWMGLHSNVKHLFCRNNLSFYRVLSRFYHVFIEQRIKQVQNYTYMDCILFLEV